MTKKNFLFGIISLSLAFTLVFGLWVWAYVTTTITATVTVGNLGLSVDPGSVNYGSVELGNQRKSTYELGQTQTIQNTGSVSEDIGISAGEYTPTYSWHLVTTITPGSNEYAHLFCTSTCDNQSNYHFIDPNDVAEVYTNLATNATSSLDLAFISPRSVNNEGVTEHVDVTLYVVAH